MLQKTSSTKQAGRIVIASFLVQYIDLLQYSPMPIVFLLAIIIYHLRRKPYLTAIEDFFDEMNIVENNGTNKPFLDVEIRK